MWSQSLVVGFTALLSFSEATTTPKNELIVQTTSGEIHGFINQTSPDVRQFLGIPYAEAPVGDLRFAPPQTKKNAGVINATYYGASCMQQTSTTKTIYTEYMREFLIEGPTSEDCLFVHVWAPKQEKTSKKGLPVLLYIPGGGFTGGGTNSPYKFPHHWVQQTQSHIVVIMNYRLNVFGYPNAREANGNYGFLDQRKAAEWTHENIAAFGGDPSKITLWGQSAGGASAAVYGLANYEKPLVTGIIADSGSSNIGFSADATHSNFTTLAGQVGCGGLNSTAEIACVRKVDAVTLVTTLSNYTNAGTKPTYRFWPVPDEKTAFANVTARILSGKVAKIPYIMGTNSNEGAAWAPVTPDGPGQAALDTITQTLMECPTAREIRARNLAGLVTYRYQYAGNFTNISPLYWIGATHSSELPLLFGTHDDFRGPSTQFEYSVSKTMQDLWLDFAVSPRKKPAFETFTWFAHDGAHKQTVLFAANGTAAQYKKETGAEIDERCRARGLYP